LRRVAAMPTKSADTKPALADPDRGGTLYACWHPL